MKFKVGDRVVLNDECLVAYDEYSDDCFRGKVSSIEGKKITVIWDDSWRNENAEALTPDELISEEKADKIIDKLEKQYEKWASPIRKKIEDAAKLLAEADKLAQKKNRDLAEMHELVSPLLCAMDDIGWSTSSLSC